jgi:L-cysteine desulfidase
MEKRNAKYTAYVQTLKEELVPAMGCTEPIALAYGAARAREVLGEMPDRVVVGASGSIIKNVKSVIVPNTDHLKGIPAAAAAGIVAGDADKELEVIASVSSEQTAQMKEFMEQVPITVEHIDNGITFDIVITLYKGVSYARVRIANYHTNIVLVEKNGEILEKKPVAGESEDGLTDRSLLNMKDILDFARTVDIEDVREVLERQIDYNWAIAEEGIRGNYGANIGSVLLDMEGESVRVRAKAMAAAGSDARMNGCELPVIINSGSGNQGITASVPVIVYAKDMKVSHETLLRALTLSNLTAIHQKTAIGRLSAYCGAVSAGAGAGAGIAYLHGGDYKEIVHTVVNALAIVSGIVCDGAKASCAAKIASAVDAGILGYQMYIRGQQFYGGDGIVTKGVEETLKNVGRLGKEGMKATNEEIIRIMIGE